MPVRVAIAGAGHMGALHAGKLAKLAEEGGVVCAGVADRNIERAQALDPLLAGAGAPRFVADLRELLPECDAVIAAVPTRAHYAVVRDALRSGCDVLVEKPIAATLEHAQELIELADAWRRVLQVGHLEWFNSGLRSVRERVKRPRFAEVHRLGPFPHRATDVDVVRDLMIHDLDLLQQLVGEEPASIDAIGVPVLSEDVDIANARLVFPGGCVANLTASRVSAVAMRKFRFFQREGYFAIDLLAQTAVVFRREQAAGGSPRIEMEELKVDPGDALELQLRAFLQSVRRRTPPAVDAIASLGALRTALRVRAAMPSLEELE